MRSTSSTIAIRALSLLTYFVLSLTPVLAGPATGPARPGAWTLDPARSHVGFTVTKLGFSDVDGEFHDFSGDVRYDPVRPENSSIRWRVGVASVKTDAADRDSSLQSPEYFDAARYPDLTFESRRVKALDAMRLEVAGDITIRGRTRPLTIIAVPAASGGGFETRFEIDRYDFDVAGGRVMGRLIGRTVRVHLVARAEEGTK